MCGRFVSKAPSKQIEKEFGVEVSDDKLFMTAL